MRDNPYGGAGVSLRSTKKSYDFKTPKYKKPTGATNLPEWFKEIRSGSNFMPSQIKVNSYSYLSQAESPFRAQVYSSASQPTQMDIGTRYHRPTEDVAVEIKKNATIWQDIKNLGGKVVSHGANLLGRVGDVFSRGGYAIRNMYLNDLQMNYMTADSPGGEKVTGMEKAASYVDMLFLGLNKGQLDDTLAAGWRGLSGKDKTSTKDILDVIAPKWTKEHQTGATWLGVAGDIIIDPVTWLTMGINPGSITKTLGAGTKLLQFDKAGAAAIMQDTIFTKAGMKQTMATMRSDALARETNKLLKQTRKASLKGQKALENSFRIKAGKKATDYYLAKATEAAIKESQFIAQDLKGINLAKLIAKQNLKNPLVAMNTASRFTTGAKKGTEAIQVGKTVKETMDAYHLSMVDALKQDPKWAVAYDNLKGQDIKYQHGRTGEPYVADLSKADTFDEWLLKVVQHAAPVAKVAEHGPQAARSRMGRIGATEARGRQFIDALTMKHSEVTRDKLTADAQFHYDAIVNGWSKKGSNAPTPEELESDAIPKIPEHEYNAMTVEELLAVQSKAWKSAGKGKRPGGKNGRVIVIDDQGVASVRNVKADAKFSKQNSKTAGARASAAAEAEARTPQEKALDQLSGVDDISAGRRAYFAKHFEEVSARSPEHAAVVSRLVDRISNYEDADEVAKVQKILNDTSIPIEKRIAALIEDDSIENETIADLVETFFKVDVINGAVHYTQGKNTTKAQAFQNLPEVIKAVLADRWEMRVEQPKRGTPVGGTKSEKLVPKTELTMEDGKILVRGQDPRTTDPQSLSYTRELNSEIALGYMDGLRAGLDYAIRMKLWEDDPELMFQTIMKPLGEYINNLTASAKAEVMQLVYNMSGIRLPETFVPTMADIDKMLSGDFVLMKPNGKDAYSMPTIWRNLAVKMQGYVTEMFGPNVIQVPRFGTSSKAAYDVEAMVKGLESVAAMPLEKMSTSAARQHNEWVDKVLKLKDHVKQGSLLNGTEPTVNNYTFLDFLLHHKQIIASQETSIRTTSKMYDVDGVTEIRYQQKVGIGRLSALDSFDFVDPEVIEGLETIAELKRLANKQSLGGAESERIVAARKALATLFLDNGGRVYLNGVYNPNAPDMTFQFSSMGMHARLKEGSFSNDDFGPKFAADIAEHLWGEATLNHEFQKALHNTIISLIAAEGHTPTTASTTIIKSIDKQFAGHDRLKKLLHPVVNRSAEAVEAENLRLGAEAAEAGEEFVPHVAGSVRTTYSTDKMNVQGLQEALPNRNRVNALQNTPTVEAAGTPEITLPTPWGGSFWNISKQNMESMLKILKEDHGIELPDLPGQREALLRVGESIGDGVISVNRGTVKGRPAREFTYIGKDADGNVITKRVFTETPTSMEGLKPLKQIISKVKGQFRSLLSSEDAAEWRHTPYDKTQNTEMIPGNVMEKAPGKRMLGFEKAADEIPVSPRQQAVADVSDAYKANVRAGMYDNAPQPQSPAAEAAPPVADSAPAPNRDPEQDVEAVDPEDFVNTARPTDGYTPEEQEAIRNWNAQMYGEHPPAQVAKTLHQFNIALSQDLLLAQISTVDAFKDMQLANKATVRFMGVPFMPIGHPINAMHATAGITTFAEMRQSNFRFWNNIRNKVKPTNFDSGMAKNLKHITRQSQLVDGALNQILTTTVNAVAVRRRVLVDHVNDVSRRLIGKDTEFAFTPLNSMSNKQKWRRANELFFDPATIGNAKAFDEFNELEGNPLSDIAAGLEKASIKAFGDEISPDRMKQTISLMNHYLGENKLKFSQADLNELSTLSLGWLAKDQIRPYTREWFAKVREHPRFMESPYGKDNHKNLNLTKLHMGVMNAALRIEEGRELYRGVWTEFGFRMSPAQADYWNKDLSPHVVKDDGVPLRGKVIPLDDIAAKFDIDRRYIPNEFLGQGLYVQEEFIPEIRVLFDYMHDMSEINNTIDTRMLNKVLSQFKASVTIYKIPTYPVRNLIADVFMSAMDGLTNPRYYRDAGRVMQNVHKDSKAMDKGQFNYENIIDKNFLNEELARNMTDPGMTVDPAVGAPTTTMYLKGQNEDYKINDTQIYALYEELGLGQNRVSSDFAESIPQARRNAGMRKVGGGADAARSLNNYREDWSRLAHFMYALEQEAPLGGDLMDIARRARDRVQKHHFDYNDISTFERRTLGQWVPFYKWTRNVIPYTIASVIARPYAIKIEQGLQEGIGATLDDNKDDPRTDFVVPEYIRRENAVDIGWYSDPNGNKFMQWMSLGLPLSETIAGTMEPIVGPLVDESAGPFDSRLANVGAGALRVPGAMLNPVAGAAMQAVTGRKVWASGPQTVDPTGWVGTLAGVIPGQIPLKTAWDDFSKAGNIGANREANKNQLAELLQSIGAVKVKDNSEGAQIGELKRLQDKNTAQRSVLEGELVNKLIKKYPQLSPEQAQQIVVEYRTQLRTANNG